MNVSQHYGWAVLGGTVAGVFAAALLLAAPPAKADDQPAALTDAQATLSLEVNTANDLFKGASQLKQGGYFSPEELADVRATLARMSADVTNADTHALSDDNGHLLALEIKAYREGVKSNA